MLVRRCRVQSRRFSDRLLLHAVRVHVDDNHRRTVVHDHVRHPPEPPTEAGRLRQHNGNWLDLLGGHGRVAVDGHQWILKNQVSRQSQNHDPTSRQRKMFHRLFEKNSLLFLFPVPLEGIN